jgi:hypothetical protein
MLTITLAPGYTWPAGSKIDLAKLRLTAAPTVQVGGAIGWADLADNGTSTTKLMSQPWMWATGDSGVNAMSLTLTNPATALVNGLTIAFRAASTKTSAATINLDGLGVVGVYRSDGRSLLPYDIVGGQVVVVKLNTDVFINKGWLLMSAAAEPPLHYAVAVKNGANYELDLGLTSPAYYTGMTVRFRIQAADGNGAAPKLKIGNLNAVEIKSALGAGLLSGELPGGSTVTVMHDGTNFIVQSPADEDDYAAESGAVDALAVIIPRVKALVDGLRIRFKASHSTTAGGSTLAVSGLTAKALVRFNLQPTRLGTIEAGKWYSATFDATANPQQWVLDPIITTYQSTELALPGPGGTARLDVSHALGGLPDWSGWYLVCTTGDLGYSAGWRVNLHDAYVLDGGMGYSWRSAHNDTTLSLVIQIAYFYVCRYDTKATTQITNTGNWRIIAKAGRTE